jgi:hypothetical protein
MSENLQTINPIGTVPVGDETVFILSLDPQVVDPASVGIGIPSEVTDFASTTTRSYVIQDELTVKFNVNGPGFKVGDLLLAKRQDYNQSGDLSDMYQVKAQVVEVLSGDTMKIIILSGLEHITDAEKAYGMEFIRYGNVSDRSRQGGVQILSAGTGAPYINIYDGIDSSNKSPEDSLYSKVRGGNLSEIVDDVIPEAFFKDRWGLFTKDIILKNGTISVGVASGFAVGDGIWINGFDPSDPEFRVGTFNLEDHTQDDLLSFKKSEGVKVYARTFELRSVGLRMSSADQVIEVGYTPTDQTGVLIDGVDGSVIVKKDGKERVKMGKVTDTKMGLVGKNSAGNTIFELSDDSELPYVGGYANGRDLELELMKVNFQYVSWAQFAIYDDLNSAAKKLSGTAVVDKSIIITPSNAANLSANWLSIVYRNITDVYSGEIVASDGNFANCINQFGTWFDNEPKGLTLEDSRGSTLNVLGYDSQTDLVELDGAAELGSFRMFDKNPSYAVAFLSYLDASNGGSGYVKFEVSFNNGVNWQTFYQTNLLNSLGGTNTVNNSGFDYQVRITLTNDSQGRSPQVFRYLVATDPAPWRF